MRRKRDGDGREGVEGVEGDLGKGVGKYGILLCYYYLLWIGR